jgi:hypothetical protein
MSATQNFRVDSFVSGLAIKAPVEVATDLPITLSAPQTVNSRVLVVGDRVLVKDQADPLENGIYTVETSAWNRAGDMDGNRDIVGGTVVPAYRVSDATFVYWILAVNANVLEPGTDALNFSVYYDPAVGGGVSLPISTVQNASLTADNSGGWIENPLVHIAARSVLVDYTSISDNMQLGPGTGVNKRISTQMGAIELIADSGNANIVVFGGSDLSIIQGGVFYIEGISAALTDLVNTGQFWVRDDATVTPMFTDNFGADTVLNASPTFAAPLVLLDDEEIQFGTSTDAILEWTAAGIGGSDGLRLAFADKGTLFAINDGPEIRFYNPAGSGYISLENKGVTSNNEWDWNSSGASSVVNYDVGAWDHTDHLFSRPVLDDYAIQHVSAGSAAGVLDIDFEDGNSHFLTLTENVTTMTISNPPATGLLGQIEMEILQDSPARTIAWPASVKWPGGTAPDLTTTNATYLIHLRTRLGGTTYLGTFAENFS